jgi:hypothetical protein
MNIITLFILALPIACVTWTITHEEIFREVREWAEGVMRRAKTYWRKKLPYPLTCEYCLSHYITIVFLIITRYRLYFTDWRGYVVGGFALVWIANIYMNLYARLRLDIKLERTDVALKEQELAE